MVTLMLGAGIVLRVLEYLARRSLWTDETWIALDVGTKAFGGRRAPFLALEWLVTRVGGMNELALRALPFAAGVALLLLVPRFATRFLDTRAAVAFATALAAVSPALFYFSNETKAYGLDPLLAVLLTGGAFHVLDTSSSRRAWVRLVAIGAVALAFSIPAVFVLAAIALALATAPEVRRHPGARRWLAIASALGVVAFVGVYKLLYRESATDIPLERWWEGGFLTPWAPSFLRRSWVAGSTTVGEYLVGGRPEPVVVVLAALLFLAGLAVIARRRGPTAFLLVAGPTALALAASVVHVYPIAPRTMLFVLPHILVALAAGVVWLVDRLPPRARSVTLTVAGVLWCAPAFAADVDRIVYPRLPEAPRLAVQEFDRRHAEAEPVYIAAEGVLAWLFYTTDWARPDTTRIRVEQHATGSYTYRGRTELIGTESGMAWRLVTGDEDLEPTPGWADREATRIRDAARPYIWIFFSHFFVKSKRALADAVARNGGRAVYAYETDGAAVYRYRFGTGRPSDAGLVPARRPAPSASVPHRQDGDVTAP